MQQINSSLQESILALLAHSDEYGKIIVNMVEPTLFEGDYKIIAERAVEFWRIHGTAPKAHTIDLVQEIVNDKNNRKASTFRSILLAMAETVNEVNAEYVIRSLHQFVRTQKMMIAIMTSAEKIEAKREMGISEIEDIWHEMLRSRDISFDPGLRLTQYARVLAYIRSRDVEFSTGIQELDQRHVRPARGTVMLMIAPSGYGKTFFLIHLGKRALMARKKVLHVSLEMDEAVVAQRYYQALFGATKREPEVEITGLRLRSNYLTDFSRYKVIPDFTFSDPSIGDELETRINWLGTRCNDLLIKRFPGRSLTMNGLRAYLDQLESIENFVPDLLLLDYIGVTRTDARDHRITLGRNYEEFRAILVERNIAGATAQQSSKKGMNSMRVNSGHVAEDWSLIGTSDIVMTLTRTEGEHRLGLGRLYVTKVREEESGFGVLLTQNYSTGQFAIESTLLTSRVHEMVAEYSNEDKKDDDDEDNDDDDDD